MRTIEGRCHCGTLSYVLHWPGADDEPIRVRACGCSFCVKHGGVYTSHPDAALHARVREAGEVEHYAFGTRTAQFHVCRRCGAVPFVTSLIDGRLYAVVNVNTFEDVDRASFDAAATDFEGESVEQRLARRRQRWIARVTIEAADD